MLYIADTLTETLLPAHCTLKVMPISTSMISQIAHDEGAVSLVCDEGLAKSIGRALVIEDFPMMGGEEVKFVPGDVIAVLLSTNGKGDATWTSFVFLTE